MKLLFKYCNDVCNIGCNNIKVMCFNRNSYESQKTQRGNDPNLNSFKM